MGKFLPLVRDICTDARVWALLLTLQVPALRALFKYVPEPLLWLAVPAALFLAFDFYGGVLHAGWCRRFAEKWLNTAWPVLLMAAGLALVVAIVYPYADGLKAVGGGSDADDAIIAGATALWNGANPYATRTYFNNPISPGPGWIVLWAPLVKLGVYWLITPISLLLAAWTIKKESDSWQAAALFMLFCLSSLMVWELAVVGGDLVAFSCLLVVATALLPRAQGWPALIGLAVLVGTLASGRIVFGYLPLVFALMYWPIDRHRTMVFGLMGLAVTAAWHGVFYAWSPENYAPLHLLAKGEGMMTPFLRNLALIACAGSGLLMLRLLANTAKSRFTLLWLALITPLIFVALGDLMVHRAWSLAGWEGANYLVPPLAVLAAWVANEKSREL